MIDYGLYVVTDENLSRGRSHFVVARAAIRGGATVVQMRDKTMSDKEFYEAAKEISVYARGFKVPFIINDRLDIALMLSDGVHLGKNDIPLSEARAIAPDDFIIGVSVSSVEEALDAHVRGADYLAVSPLFDTSSKDDAGRGLGLEMLKKIKSSSILPVIAIGGINEENVNDVIAAGADGVAVISAVVSQESVTLAACRMKKLINGARESRIQSRIQSRKLSD